MTEDDDKWTTLPLSLGRKAAAMNGDTPRTAKNIGAQELRPAARPPPRPSVIVESW